MKKYLIILLFSFIVVSADAQIDEYEHKMGRPHTRQTYASEMTFFLPIMKVNFTAAVPA